MNDEIPKKKLQISEGQLTSLCAIVNHYEKSDV